MGRVSVCFWFDVEDYITPESDDALKSLLKVFVQRGAPGTWKIVGEKYRALRERNRGDILDLLHRQDVGYHTDNHSRHPVISEYVTGLGWEAGIEEFDHRERPGLEQLRREFGTVSCYGQPGGAWAPQAFAALNRWGVPMYLDEGSHVGLGKQPFWFQNVFTAFNVQENCLRANVWQADKTAALETARGKLEAAVARLRPDGGFISIYYHPCEFATSEFWDGVNFSRGANPPRSRWQGAPLLSEGEAAARLDLFAGLLDLALNHPDVDVVDAAELLGRYREGKPSGAVPLAELVRLAEEMGGQISYGISNAGALSPAEVLTGLLAALRTWAAEGALPATVELASPLGPSESCAAESGGSAGIAAVAQAAGAALAYAGDRGRLPVSVSLGAAQVGPAGLFAASLAALRALEGGASGDSEVDFGPARLALEGNVAANGPGMWTWVPFPEGFDAPDLMDLTRLQAWTLKPAELR